MTLRHILYVSSAASRMSSDELERILAVSRRNNEAVGVTGLLVYEDGNFMQALEGPENSVAATLARVRADSRHRDIRTVVDFLHPERAFADWHMGFEYREKTFRHTDEAAFTHAETMALLGNSKVQPNIMHRLMQKIGAGSFFR